MSQNFKSQSCLPYFIFISLLSDAHARVFFNEQVDDLFHL
jgi:hypothetical protein